MNKKWLRSLHTDINSLSLQEKGYLDNKYAVRLLELKLMREYRIVKHRPDIDNRFALNGAIKQLEAKQEALRLLCKAQDYALIIDMDIRILISVAVNYFEYDKRDYIKKLKEYSLAIAS
jgi:hypothetical protein